MKIEKNTFEFLKELKLNNNRDWFSDNKFKYQEAHQNVKNIFQEIHYNLQKHDEIEKSKMMRIYRDVRFSKDKTPYKPHFANSFSRLGKELRGGYFLRIKPNESIVAGGFWEPNKEDIFRIRKEIEQDSTEIRDLLLSDDFKTHFDGKFESIGELKTAPRGFRKDHPDIDLLRKKGFVAIKQFTDKEVLADDFIENVDVTFKALRPFFNLFSDILTTNLNGESII